MVFSLLNLVSLKVTSTICRNNPAYFYSRIGEYINPYFLKLKSSNVNAEKSFLANSVRRRKHVSNA